MIYGKCADWERYAAIGGAWFGRAFEAVNSLGADTPDGRIEIVPGRLFINVFSYDARLPEDIRIEIHREYIDIQRVLSGIEYGVCAPAEELRVLEPYDADRDCGFFAPEEAKLSRMVLTPDRFAVFFPGEGHSCHRLGDCLRIRKAVAKIRL